MDCPPLCGAGSRGQAQYAAFALDTQVFFFFFAPGSSEEAVGVFILSLCLSGQNLPQLRMRVYS